MTPQTLPIPPHFAADRIGEVWKVPYQERADAAEDWAKQYRIPPAAADERRICLLLVDVQNTFCIPGFELFVAGASGTGAVDDNRRLCEFIYRNLGAISEICLTMDTHQAMQIFHSIFLINEKGQHPAPFSVITPQDIETGKWRFNEALAESLHIRPAYGQRYIAHYVQRLKESGKYDLTIWPYHAMLGGIGHAIVSAVEEAVLFHGITRLSQPDFQVKGKNPLTENYSVLSPEVLTGPDGEAIAPKNRYFIDKLMNFDAVIVAGQAKSHCVAWTIDDLLKEIALSDQGLAEKVYLLEDCTSPVVIPDVIDYTQQADAAFARFADAGMKIVRSTDPIAQWPGMPI